MRAAQQKKEWQMRKNWFLLVLILGMMLNCVKIFGDNNFSQLLLDLKISNNDSVVTFDNPRHGWVYFKTSQNVASLKLSCTKEYTVVVDRGEGFAELPIGRYAITRNDLASPLVVRTVPEILFCSMNGNFSSPASDPYLLTTDKKNYREGLYLYNWNYLRQTVLRNFNAVICNTPVNPELAQWQREDKKVIAMSDLIKNVNSRLTTWLTESDKRPNLNGIIVDEFVTPSGHKGDTADFGYTQPGLGFEPQTISDIHTFVDKNKKVRFYAFLGIPWNSRIIDNKPLLDAIIACNGVLVWEAYANSNDNYLNELNGRITDRLSGFLKINSEAFKSIMICPAIFEYANLNYNVDFKVFLDMQMHLFANNPAVKGVMGLSFWRAHYTDPEILRWYAALLRHYAIEGNTTMLSQQYGFVIEPKILTNPDWSNKLENWTVNMASEKSVSIKGPKEWNFTGFYFPGNRLRLLSFMKNKNSVNSINSISQPLKNLEAGKMYSLMTNVTVPGINGYNKYCLNVNLTNCEIISKTERVFPDFTKPEKYWNSVKIVFRYTGGDCILTVSDANQAGIISPDELLIDAIQVTPYFADFDLICK